MNRFSLLLIILIFLSTTACSLNDGNANINTTNQSMNNDTIEGCNDKQTYNYDVDVLFLTDMDNFKVIPIGDLQKKEQSPISHDFDKDGINETIHIGLAQSNYKITGIYKGKKYDLHHELIKIVEYGWGEDLHLEPKCSLQITYHDLDSDNIDELIISFGGIDSMCYSVVYKVQNSSTDAFSYIGHIDGGYRIELWGNDTIWCPIGSQGLGDIYVLKNGRFIINGNEPE